jgi:hypothetical protein
MSLYALPVTNSDITALQQGILFTTTSATDVANQVSSINTPGSTTSVTSYANQLLASVQSSSQAAMGVTALMAGQSQAAATLANLVTNPGLIPSFQSFALTNNLHVTEVVGEDIGLAFADNTNFVANYGGLELSAFTSALFGLTGISQAFTANQVQYFLGIYTSFGLPGNPTANAAQIQAAAYGVVFGLDVALNLEGTGSQAQTTQMLVKNALFDIAQTAESPPGSVYVVNAPLASQPVPFPFQPSRGGFPFNLTITQDTIVLTHSNTVVNGIFGGAGATWTAGDTITAAADTTDQVFNITSNGLTGNINLTNLPTNKVSGVQTLNVFATTGVGALNTESVSGDFSATGPMGPWTGLTQLNVNSGSSPLGGSDNLTAAVTTAVLVNDTAVATAAGETLTVNGSLTTTVNETNTGPNLGGIAVNGGNGTTTVSITQTEAVASGNDGIVTIVDANGASTTATGTITKIMLDGLSHFANVTTGPNMIIDNALTDLTINHSDLSGPMVGLAIIDDLKAPIATTLTLSLGADGISAGGVAVTQLVIADVKSDYSTIHLSLGAQNSFANIIDNGLITLDTPAAGTGALVGLPGLSSEINDSVSAAIKFDFSGLNGPNDIDVNRLMTDNADVYTLGNFGTYVGVPTAEQQLTIENDNPANTATINFGSGAYLITDALHPAGTHSYVQTAANGAGLAHLSTASQWAIIINLHGAPNSDTLTFATDNVKAFVNSGAAPSIAMGIANGLTTAAHTASEFEVGGNTFIFDHADNSATLTAADAMVQLVGVHPIAAVSAANAITFTV